MEKENRTIKKESNDLNSNIQEVTYGVNEHSNGDFKSEKLDTDIKSTYHSLTQSAFDTMSEEELAAEIEKHNYLYWEKNEPIISDEEFDSLTKALREKNPNHPVLQKLYTPAVESTGKVKHSKPMLSLDKAYSLTEVLSWANKYARNEDEIFLIQPKYDGISATFENGILATRGDGYEGENITDKLPLIELEAPGYKGKLERAARGEILIRKDDFEKLYSKIRKKDGKPYKNARNAVAGIMGLKEIDDLIAQSAKLTLVDYNLITYRVSLRELPEKWENILSEIEKLPYPMDGIVIKIADEKYRESLGYTSHHPRGQIAFKFSGIRKETLLKNVVWSFGKNCLTPVAEVEPVEIGGITIRHASLHNAKNIIDKDIRIGDTVIVERAGDVIPYIVDSIPGKERKSAIISNCPCCGSELTMEGPELCCKNPECFETKLQKLLASVKSIGIERLGEPNLRRMMSTLNVQSLSDIFRLSITDILKLEGFKEKSAQNLYNEIQKAREVPDYKILSAMNIPGIGPTVAKTILEKIPLDKLGDATVEQLSEIEGIGPERATALKREFERQRDFLKDLLSEVTVITRTSEFTEKNRPTICFTGKMPEKRSYYENLAKEHGYIPVDNVTEKLSLLVAMNPNEKSSKIKKAEKYGVMILPLNKWLEDLKTPSYSTNQDSHPSLF